LTNDDLSQTLETSDEWIRRRTGIRSRHIAADGVLTSDLAVEAALRALEKAEIRPEEVDLVLVATTTPDRTFPSTATIVQGKLGLAQGMAFDISAVCSGFLYATTVADTLLQQGQATCALVIGAETFSRLLDWSDRTTAPLFGDGAGAVLLRAEEQPSPTGILASRLYADGGQWSLLYTDGGPSLNQKAGVVRMQGREVFRQAVEKMVQSLQEVLQVASVPLEEITWVIPHQANLRILEAVAERMAMPMERVLVTVDHHANTSGASIPLALEEGFASGRLAAGQTLLLTAIGAGLTWGASIIRLP
jgi:3-oxoacyl-[acyl-carrier-protein] synthase-3